MTTSELLELLEESQQLLNQATDIEDHKRSRIRRENLKAELARCSAAAAYAHEQASGQLGNLKVIIDQARDGVEALRSTATGSGRRRGDQRVYGELAQAVADMSVAHRTALEEIEEGQRELTPAVWGIMRWWRLGPMDVRQHRQAVRWLPQAALV